MISPKQTIDEILKEIGYNDSPLRQEIKQAFAKWLQQDSYQSYLQRKVIRELLEKLEQ